MSTNPKVKYTEKAAGDLSEIVDYTLHRWGSTQAHIYIDGLEKLAQLLAGNPDIGKSCNDLYDGLTAFPYQSHVLYYLREPHGITVARVLHRKMNPSLQFGDSGSGWPA